MSNSYSEYKSVQTLNMFTYATNSYLSKTIFKIPQTLIIIVRIFKNKCVIFRFECVHLTLRFLDVRQNRIGKTIIVFDDDDDDDDITLVTVYDLRMEFDQNILNLVHILLFSQKQYYSV